MQHMTYICINPTYVPYNLFMCKHDLLMCHMGQMTYLSIIWPTYPHNMAYNKVFEEICVS